MIFFSKKSISMLLLLLIMVAKNGTFSRSLSFHVSCEISAIQILNKTMLTIWAATCHRLLVINITIFNDQVLSLFICGAQNVPDKERSHSRIQHRTHQKTTRISVTQHKLKKRLTERTNVDFFLFLPLNLITGSFIHSF